MRRKKRNHMTNQTLQFDDDFYDYALELEKAWKKSQPKYTDLELLEIFPEAKEIIPTKIIEWESQKKEVVAVIKSKLAAIKRETKDENSRIFWREWVKACEGQELFEIENQISRLKNLQWLSKPKKTKVENKDHITDEEIQLATQKPIESLLERDRTIRRSGRNLTCLCPLHEEKHASFFIYPESNTCWCFGCNQGGNSINLVRLLYDYSFKDAVNYLNGKL